MRISLTAPGPAVAYDECATCGEGDESTLAAERDRRGPDLTSQNRGGAGTASAPHGNRRTTVRKYQNALEGAPPGLWCRPPKEHNLPEGNLRVLLDEQPRI